ncbi:hypothetical protein HZA55_06870 [Candidatus Poribacteria bacterium]|nr:hypothetical protein [Candidatus Poribacteria bacterium]
MILEPLENRIIAALFILNDIPVLQTVDIIINYWNKLLIIDKQVLLEAVREIGDKKFIPLIKREIKEGEFDEIATFIFLCHINNIDNPELKKFEHLFEEQEKKLKDAMSLLESGNITRLIDEPLNIELKCRNCKKSYHYNVGKVFIEKNSSDYFIQDKILCKNCNSLDHLNEALADYEKKLKKDPENPEHLIGYANTLSTAKRTEDAIEYYKKAVISDPLAIEAYASLGEIAEAKKDDIGAYNYFKKALKIVHNFNIYKSKKENRDEYKDWESININLNYCKLNILKL